MANIDSTCTFEPEGLSPQTCAAINLSSANCKWSWTRMSHVIILTKELKKTKTSNQYKLYSNCQFSRISVSCACNTVALFYLQTARLCRLRVLSMSSHGSVCVCVCGGTWHQQHKFHSTLPLPAWLPALQSHALTF